MLFTLGYTLPHPQIGPVVLRPHVGPDNVFTRVDGDHHDTETLTCGVQCDTVGYDAVSDVFPLGMIRRGDVVVMFFQRFRFELLCRVAEATIRANDQISRDGFLFAALGLALNANDLTVFLNDAGD